MTSPQVRGGSPTVLDDFHAMPAAEAERGLMACCAAKGWASRLARRRPYPSVDALRTAADREFDALTWADIAQALAAHPRIGERAPGSGMDATWSRREQSAATGIDPPVFARYERRFGMVFLICADGLPAERILASLDQRMRNDPETERTVVRQELGKIVQLRLARWLGE
jgi:2-oxo-4-hydroxy-4-carboxy-5-ureidoimidazoline decarboxylase